MDVYARWINGKATDMDVHRTGLFGTLSFSCGKALGKKAATSRRTPKKERCGAGGTLRAADNERHKTADVVEIEAPVAVHVAGKPRRYAEGRCVGHRVT